MNISDSSNPIPKNSTAAFVRAPVFGQNLKFGDQFSNKYEFQSFRQLVKSENMAINQVRNVSDNQNGSPKMGFQYSRRSYGRKPIVEPFPPLKKHVTISLNFEKFEDFGTLK